MARAKDAVHILDQLVTLCGDAILGYREAARVTVDSEVRSLLERNASEREEIASVLTYKLIELGHEPRHDRSIAGAIHRRYLETMAAVTPGDPARVLDACATGERETLAQFSFALGQALPDDVHNVVQSQLGRVLSACAALQRIRHDVADQRRRATASQ